MLRIFLCIFLLGVLNSCNSSPDETDTKERPVVSELAALKKHYVTIMGMKFKPEILKVHKGDSIVFSNMDIVDHDITEEKTSAWTSSVIPAGTSWKMVAIESCDYFCSIHVVMKGKIIVE
jgi:plastocyanin